MYSLTLFDKINLANCATKRAKAHFKNKERFDGEFDSARLWKIHKTHSVNVDNTVINYTELL